MIRGEVEPTLQLFFCFFLNMWPAGAEPKRRKKKKTVIKSRSLISSAMFLPLTSPHVNISCMNDQWIYSWISQLLMVHYSLTYHHFLRFTVYNTLICKEIQWTKRLTSERNNLNTVQEQSQCRTCTDCFVESESDLNDLLCLWSLQSADLSPTIKTSVRLCSPLPTSKHQMKA